jgi:hypothetical protein
MAGHEVLVLAVGVRVLRSQLSHADVAQLWPERCPGTTEVTGSTPVFGSTNQHHANAARLVVHPFRNRKAVGSSPTVGSLGDAQVCSTALQAAPARFDTEVVHFARVAQWERRRAQIAEVQGSNPWSGTHNGLWRSLVARSLRGREAVGSNPASPTYATSAQRFPEKPGHACVAQWESACPTNRVLGVRVPPRARKAQQQQQVPEMHGVRGVPVVHARLWPWWFGFDSRRSPFCRPLWSTVGAGVGCPAAAHNGGVPGSTPGPTTAPDGTDRFDYPLG